MLEVFTSLFRLCEAGNTDFDGFLALVREVGWLCASANGSESLVDPLVSRGRPLAKLLRPKPNSDFALRSFNGIGAAVHQ